MCWTYDTQTICTACRAIQPGVYALIEHRDPDCEKSCHKPWPEGKPEEDPKLGYVDVSQCSFCQRINEPLFLKEKQGQEDFVRGELERMRTLLGDRAEEKRKRRERRLKRKAVREESDERGSDEQEAHEQEADEQETDEQETNEQEANETTQAEPETVDLT